MSAAPARHGAAERFVAVFERTWGSEDPERYAPLWHPEGVRLHPLMEDPLPREKVARHLRAGLAAGGDRSPRVERWVAAGDTVMIEWTAAGVIAGQLVELRGAERFTLSGDRAVAWERLFRHAAVPED